ncbi:MAG: 50S ribosomal protein L18e [Crenarchaeota archaeon]|nr:50S ribosomal protein L18e [Thermoproteota archaeon]
MPSSRPPTGPTNERLRMLIRFLRKASKENKAKIWRYVAELLEKPRRKRIEVNVGKLERLCTDGDVVVIPGKLLGDGVLTKKITVAAYAFSKSAYEKVLRAGGRPISIPDLVRENPKGSNVKIII